MEAISTIQVKGGGDLAQGGKQWMWSEKASSQGGLKGYCLDLLHY